MTPLRFLLAFVPGEQVLQKGSIMNNTFLLFPFPQASEPSMNLNISKMVYNREICRLGPNYNKNGKESSRTHANQILPSRNRPKQCPSFLVTVSNRIKPLWYENCISRPHHFLKIFNNYSSSPNGLWVNSPWGRSFSKSQLVGQKYRDKTTLASKTWFSRHCFGFQSRRFSPLVGYSLVQT